MLQALRMVSFRQGSQGSIARRAALSAFALYALLLQAFLATSAPAPASAFPGGISGITCSLDGSGSGSGSGTPGGDPARHHGLCCILACAAAAGAYVGTASAFAAFPAERAASPIVYALAQGLPARAPLKHNFAARGPPAII
jgi:hypothetical protein